MRCFATQTEAMLGLSLPLAGANAASELAPPRKVPAKMPSLSDNSFERTVGYRAPHPECQQVVVRLCMRQSAAWPAAQRSR